MEEVGGVGEVEGALKACTSPAVTLPPGPVPVISCGRWMKKEVGGRRGERKRS